MLNTQACPAVRRTGSLQHPKKRRAGWQACHRDQIAEPYRSTNASPTVVHLYYKYIIAPPRCRFFTLPLIWETALKVNSQSGSQMPCKSQFASSRNWNAKCNAFLKFQCKRRMEDWRMYTAEVESFCEDERMLTYAC